MNKRSAVSVSAPNFLEPMKATLVASMPAGDWIYEVKFDGYRALALRSTDSAPHLNYVSGPQRLTSDLRALTGIDPAPPIRISSSAAESASTQEIGSNKTD